MTLNSGVNGTCPYLIVRIRKDWEDMPESGLSGYLAKEEMEEYASISNPKRRREWLGGRIAAKKLLSRCLGKGDINEIRIWNDDSRAPRWSIIGDRHQFSGTTKGKMQNRKTVPVTNYSISISHCADAAGCALNIGGGGIGLDIEKPCKRDPAWLEIAFHPSEIRPMVISDHVLQTWLWTAKEAVLKLLGLGLSTDLWDVRCLMEGEPRHKGNVKLCGKARHRHQIMGSPGILFSTWAGRNHVGTIAYT